MPAIPPRLTRRLRRADVPRASYTEVSTPGLRFGSRHSVASIIPRHAVGPSCLPLQLSCSPVAAGVRAVGRHHEGMNAPALERFAAWAAPEPGPCSHKGHQGFVGACMKEVSARTRSRPRFVRKATSWTTRSSTPQESNADEWPPHNWLHLGPADSLRVLLRTVGVLERPPGNTRNNQGGVSRYSNCRKSTSGQQLPAPETNAKSPAESQPHPAGRPVRR